MKNPAYTIRGSLLADIEAVYEIEKEGSNLWKKEFFIKELEIDFSRFIVAEQESQVIAFAIAWEIAKELQLMNIGVTEKFKRSGIGTALIRYLVGTSAGPEKIYVELKEKNISAFHFYTSIGFVKTGIRNGYYADDNAILMEKTLLK